jgi:hypothetical protein
MTTLSVFDHPATGPDGDSPAPVTGAEVTTTGDAASPLADLPTADDAAPTTRSARSARSARQGGLTLPMLAFAALVASPALWGCLVRHELPVQVMLERYVLIAVGCLAVSEVVRRLLPQPVERSVVSTIDAVADGSPLAAAAED